MKKLITLLTFALTIYSHSQSSWHPHFRAGVNTSTVNNSFEFTELNFTIRRMFNYNYGLQVNFSQSMTEDLTYFKTAVQFVWKFEDRTDFDFLLSAGIAHLKNGDFSDQPSIKNNAVTGIITGDILFNLDERHAIGLYGEFIPGLKTLEGDKTNIYGIGFQVVVNLFY
ncbi:hypothetical protein [Abyssalbus ytuae]|uniref:Uncharacterized protein n=1 Tax=Abyssalbus ytuae TaxID=2926907 RepID=A0A9E6ZQA3_9FLAO|nr:hypothetical protein [Abyssalbus ytuae]UOB18600.1 hypothetical protein MQE35_04750 [Abyssalbus ytuae]